MTDECCNLSPNCPCDDWNKGIDECPRCGFEHLRGYENHDLIACWNCEWTIQKSAWLEAWK